MIEKKAQEPVAKKAVVSHLQVEHQKITLPLGLGIKRIIFAALNKIGVALTTLLLISFLFIRPDSVYALVSFSVINDLMNRFYQRALSDEKIGYIFEIAELDLADHLPVIGDFWETLLFGTGNYQRHGRWSASGSRLVKRKNGFVF